MAFSATDAAFEGFRLVRRNPMALVAWALLYAVLSLASLFVMSQAMDGLMAWAERMEALESSPPASPAEWGAIFEAYGAAMGPMLWLLPLSIVVTAMLTAAIARAVLNPRARGFGYLRLGMDEVRVFVVTLVLTILISLAATAAMVAVGILIGIAAATGAGWMWLPVVLAGFAAVGLVIWLMVRLSLAVPITVAENRFAFFDSFALTKGRFWPLLGMAIIAGVMTMVIGLLSMIVTLPLGMMSNIDMWGMSGQTDAAAVMAHLDLTNPWVFVQAIVEAIVSALTVGVLYAPFAAAYRDIKGLGPETPTA